MRNLFLIWLIAILILHHEAFSQEITEFPYLQDFEEQELQNWDINIIKWDFHPTCCSSYDRYNPSWIRSTDYPSHRLNGTGSQEGYHSNACFLTNWDSDTRYDNNKVKDGTAVLTSPEFLFEDISSANLSLRYHMWGEDVEWLALEVMKDNSGAYQEIFRKTGNQYDSWRLAAIPLDSLITDADESTKLRFRIKSFIPNSNHSIVAVDDFEIKDVVYRGDELPLPYGDWVAHDSAGVSLRGMRMAVNSPELDPSHELWVNGSLKAREVLISVDSVPDYVFEEDYPLQSLDEIERYIEKNKHLPDIPSASDYGEKDGVEMGELNMLLLRKIEEMTLHMIKINKEMQLLQSEIKLLKKMDFH